MAFRFNTKNYDPDKTPKGKSDIPPAGSIVLVEVVGRQDGWDKSGTLETTSSAGNDMLQVHAVVTDGEPGEGTWLLDYIVYGNKYTEQRIGTLLDALGFDMSVDGYTFQPKMLIGRKGYVRIKHETYQDEPRAKIAYWIVPSRYEQLGLSAFDNSGKGQPAESGSAESGSEESEDDKLPF